jgi:pimeloyl-ACP methyl ester carboxylesterase
VAKTVLVHGLWNRGWSMASMAKRLRSRGHDVLVFSYPTRNDDLDGHADQLHSFIHSELPQDHGNSECHLVGHSLGGLVVLRMFARHDDLPPGRVVLMGSPVKGAAVVKRMEKLPAQKFLFGRIREDLINGFEKSPENRETGVLCGTRAFGFGQIAGKHGEPNDGSVTVNETGLDGLKDRVEMPVAHTEMLISSEVVAQVDNFLRYGKFQKTP